MADHHEGISTEFGPCKDTLEELGTLIGLSIAFNLIFSIGIIGFNCYLIYHFVWKETVQSHISAAGVSFSEAIPAVQFAKIPPIGIAAIAELGGISLDEVVSAYDKDSMERRAIVYSIMGRTAIAKKFVDNYRSVFMSKGYEGEEAVLAAAAAPTMDTPAATPMIAPAAATPMDPAAAAK